MNGIPILTYHSLHAPGERYAENDHTALASDLQTLHEAGYEIVSLRQVTERLLGGDRTWFETGRKAALSFDDGCNHDFIDFVHPDIPTLKSFYTILREFNALHRPAAPARATSFVIASPVATALLDHSCIAGRGQWHHLWWRQAAESGLLDIGNHSWDHLHPTLPFVCHTQDVRDDFSRVDNALDAALQIEQAERFIRQVVGEEYASGLFAYPDGKYSAYLVDEYFPSRQTIHAAFTTAGRPVTADADRWRIPRYCCGDHWDSPDSLCALLEGES
ncbi:MAG: polysaccharide deacetylase family protein [Wenzhouxiangellaceae bacterium]